MNDDITRSVIYKLIASNKAMLEQLDLRLEALDLSSAKLWALAFIASCDDAATITALADCVHTTKSNATAMVDRLEVSGLVTRTRSLEDRRTVRIEITPLGQTRFEQGMALFQDVNQTLNALFSPEELEQFHRYLQRIIGDYTLF